MLPLISVIVPIYNVEKFLDKCVKSILEQSYTNLEIILINDGSEDGSPNICDEYKQKDDRIKVIHKKNGGVSSARNAGLRSATGKYITFVDGDDYLEINCLMKLYKALLNSNCDIACSNIICESIEGDEINLLKNDLVDFIFNIDNYDMYNRSVYNKLFDIKCLKEENKLLLFDETLSYGEDALFIINAFIKANKIIRITDKLYHYLIHTNSAMNKFSSRSISELEAWDKIINLLKTYPQAQREAKAQYSFNAQRILINILRNNYSDKNMQKQMIYRVRQYRYEVVSSKYIPTKNKIIYCIFIAIPKLYCFGLKYLKNFIKR